MAHNVSDIFYANSNKHIAFYAIEEVIIMKYRYM